MSHGAEYTWIPGVHVKDDIPVCERCGHHAGSHHNVTSCSTRGHWWRYCRCSGYIRSSSTPLVAPGLLGSPDAR
jgi:hypothetical protein